MDWSDHLSSPRGDELFQPWTSGQFFHASAEICASFRTSCFPDVLSARFQPWSCQRALLIFCHVCIQVLKWALPLFLQVPVQLVICQGLFGFSSWWMQSLVLKMQCVLVPTCSNLHLVVLKNTCCSVEPSLPCFPDCSASFLSVKLLTLHPINMTSEHHLLRNGNHSKYFVVCAKWVGGLNSVAVRQVFAYIP